MVESTSPFLWMELRSGREGKEWEPTTLNEGVYSNEAAGFFSDNAFLARAKQVYSIKYTSHSPMTSSAADFESRLQARVLQSAATGQGKA